jgi:DNA polymerase III subunit gamma/tau
MSSLALARKWRPRSFDTLVGQEHVVRALSHALQTQRLHHAYLLTGTRGVGKTTIARILAKALNCETGITANPCGKCGACSDIDAGRFPDYLEMDAASNRGVEEMAQVLDSAVYAPTVGRYKVFVIDEVHMLTNHAFNAMLKTLEEPPGHVIFILATTDPQKVPVTVLSRCLQFGLKNMPALSVAKHLHTVLEAENVSFEPSALPLIGKAARGSMRDALSLLDQAIAFGAGEVKYADVRQMLGAIDSADVFALLDALASNDAATVLTLAHQMDQANVPLDRILQELAALAHRLALVQLDMPGEPEEELELLKSLAARFAPEELQVIYQIVLHGQRDLALAPDELTGFSMVMVRLLAFRPQGASAKPAALVVASAPVSRATAPTSIVAAALPVPVPAPAPTPAPAVAPAPTPVAALLPVGDQPIVFDGDWPALTASVRASGLVKQVLLGSELLGFDGSGFRLRVPLKNWAEASSVAKVRDALSTHFGQPVRVSIEQGSVAGPTADSLAAQDHAQRLEQATQSIQSDAFVRTLMDEFGASIVPGSIKPAQK